MMTDPSKPEPYRRPTARADAGDAPAAPSAGQTARTAALPGMTAAGATPKGGPATSGDALDAGPRRGVAVAALVTLVLLSVVVFFGLQDSTTPPTGPMTSTSSGSPRTSVTTDPTKVGESASALHPATAGQTSLPTPLEPLPTDVASTVTLELNDAQFSAPDGWELSSDEFVEDTRRAVTLIHPATGVGMQAVTLEPDGTAMGTSCEALVSTQQTQFSNVTPQLLAPVGVDSTLGSGVRCGFSGTRNSDGVPTTVTFTLVSRASDSHVMMLRNTVPDTLQRQSPEVAQLNAMVCQASRSFGVPLPLC